MDTPSQVVSNFDQAVTQWMSPVQTVRGSWLNSSHDQLAIGLEPCFRVNFQSARSICGVGLADRTGKSWVACCPGGKRAAISGPTRRPVKPLVTMGELLFQFGSARIASYAATASWAGVPRRVATF